MPISQTEGYFINPLYHFLEQSMHILVGFKMKQLRQSFPGLRQKLAHILL